MTKNNQIIIQFPCFMLTVDLPRINLSPSLDFSESTLTIKIKEVYAFFGPYFSSSSFLLALFQSHVKVFLCSTSLHYEHNQRRRVERDRFIGMHES